MQQNAQTVSSTIRSSSEAAHAADQDTRNSVSVLAQTIKDIQSQASDVDASVQVITELAQASEEISGVMEVIRNIAERIYLRLMQLLKRLALVSRDVALPLSLTKSAR